jgi:NDP-sugar pyrophosphorylase family protein
VIVPVAVLAGGLGTRVRHLTGGRVPKALLPVAGRAFIDHKLDELREAGATDVMMLIGHGAEALEEHVGDGSAFGLRVRYLEDGARLLGTGGALRRARPSLGDAFFVTYGDTLLEVPLAALQERWLSGEADSVMTVLENDDRWETSNVDVDGGFVVGYETPAHRGAHRFIDYGFLGFRASAFDDVLAGEPFDLAVVVHELIRRRSMLAFPVQRRFYDVGNEPAIRETEAFLLGRGAP